MELQITAIRDLTDRIRLFTLTAVSGDLPGYTPGAHLDVDLEEAGTRSYSLVDATPVVPAPDAYTIAVQLEPDGSGGSNAMHALAEGDRLTATAPKNSFALHSDDSPTVLIAGGIGITPILSFATALAQDNRPFALHYAARSRAVCAFADGLRDAHGDALMLWLDDSNPIDVAAVIAGAPAGAHIYCCGPKGLMEAVRSAAEAAGIPADHLRFELFETPQASAADAAFEVQINDGQVFVIPPGETIIEVLEAAGIDVMYDCQRGDCGICQTEVVDGTPDHRDVVLSDSERAAGNVMQICVSRAKSARLVLDI